MLKTNGTNFKQNFGAFAPAVYILSYGSCLGSEVQLQLSSMHITLKLGITISKWWFIKPLVKSNESGSF